MYDKMVEDSRVVTGNTRGAFESEGDSFGHRLVPLRDETCSCSACVSLQAVLRNWQVVESVIRFAERIAEKAEVAKKLTPL